ncbi:hypothetical protein AAC387_Pa08g2364 [Persea americana]
MIGTHSFQETPIVEITCTITKHNYLVLDGNNIPRIVREAFFLAASGRPGRSSLTSPKTYRSSSSFPSGINLWSLIITPFLASLNCPKHPNYNRFYASCLNPENLFCM